MPDLTISEARARAQAELELERERARQRLELENRLSGSTFTKPPPPDKTTGIAEPDYLIPEVAANIAAPLIGGKAISAVTRSAPALKGLVSSAVSAGAGQGTRALMGGAKSPEEELTQFVTELGLGTVFDLVGDVAAKPFRYGAENTGDVVRVAREFGEREATDKLGMSVRTAARQKELVRRSEKALNKAYDNEFFSGGDKFDPSTNKVISTSPEPPELFTDYIVNAKSIRKDVGNQLEQVVDDLQEVRTAYANQANDTLPKFKKADIDTTELDQIVQDKGEFGFTKKEAKNLKKALSLFGGESLYGRKSKILDASGKPFHIGGEGLDAKGLRNYLKQMNEVERAARMFDSAIMAKGVQGDPSTILAIKQKFEGKLEVIDSLRPQVKAALKKQTDEAIQVANQLNLPTELRGRVSKYNKDTIDNLLEAYGTYRHLEDTFENAAIDVLPPITEQTAATRGLIPAVTTGNKAVIASVLERLNLDTPQHAFIKANRELADNLKQIENFRASGGQRPRTLGYKAAERGIKSILNPGVGVASQKIKPALEQVNEQIRNIIQSPMGQAHSAGAVPEQPAPDTAMINREINRTRTVPSILGGRERAPMPFLGGIGGGVVPPSGPPPIPQAALDEVLGAPPEDPGPPPEPPPIPRDVDSFFNMPPEAQVAIFQDPKAQKLMEAAQTPAAKRKAMGKLMSALGEENFEQVPPEFQGYGIIYYQGKPQMTDPLKIHAYSGELFNKLESDEINQKQYALATNALNTDGTVLELTEGWADISAQPQKAPKRKTSTRKEVPSKSKVGPAMIPVYD